MTFSSSVESEADKGQTQHQVGGHSDSTAQQNVTFKRWQTAYMLAEKCSQLNQSKPSFEAQFKANQARELFVSMSEVYVTLGMRKDRFPGAPVVPHSAQQQLDKFGQTLDGHMAAPPDDLPKQRRKVLDTLLHPKQTDPDIGIRLTQNVYEKCHELGLSAQAAIEVTDEFKSFREQVAAQLSQDRNHLKSLVSELWGQLAEGADEAMQHAQERADERAQLLQLTEDQYGDGESVEISSRASSDDIVYREQGAGSSWHTVDSSSGNSIPHFKASAAPSLTTLGSLRGEPGHKPDEDRKEAKRWRKKLGELEADFNTLDENHSTKQIETWLYEADAGTQANPAPVAPPPRKRAGSEVLGHQSEDNQRKRPRMDERNDRSSTASRD